MGTSFVPEAKRSINKRAYEARQYLTPEEQNLLDKLLWSPEKEKVRYRQNPDQFVREVLKAEPAPYQEKALKALQRHKRVCFRSLHGAGKCVSAEDEIRMADGSLVQAKELIGKEFRVPAIDDEFSIHTADATAASNGVKDVLRITTDMGRVITRTLNHPLWADTDPYRPGVKGGNIRMRPQGSWVLAEDLRIGSLICAYLGNHREDEEEYPVSDAELKILAYLIGDGGLTGGGVRFTQADGLALDEFITCCNELDCDVNSVGQYGYGVSSMDKTTWSRLRQNKVLNLTRAWGIFGKSSYDKAFPSWVWKCSSRQIALLLSRLFSCDGWAYSASEERTAYNGTTERRQIGYCTVSTELAQNVHRALLRLGIQSCLTSRITKDQSGTGVLAFTISITQAEEQKLFCERVGIFGKEAAVERVYDSAMRVDWSKQQRWRERGNDRPELFKWEKIVDIEYIESQPTVMISVPGFYNYLTDFVEHNSTMMAWAVLWFIATRDECKVITTASTSRQLTEYLWPEISKWALKADWWRVGLQVRKGRELLSQKLTFGDNRFAVAVNSNDEAKVEGAHSEAIFYVFDEAKAIDTAIWDAAEGALGTGDAYAIAASTPGDSIGRFYDIQMGKAGYEDWKKIAVTLDDVIAAGRTTRVWAEQRRKAWGEDSVMYKRRVLGQFAEDDAETVIPTHLVERAQERWRTLEAQVRSAVDNDGLPEAEAKALYWGELEKLGLDPARSGVDKTAYAMRYTAGIREIEVTSKEDLMQTAGRAKAILDTTAATANIDINGLGAGAYDRLKEQGCLVTSIQVSQKTKLRDRTNLIQFDRLRDYLWWNLRELLEDEENPIALPPDDELMLDLVAPKYSYLSNGAIKVESKDETKKRLHRSPDRADAVCYAYAPDTLPYKPLIGFV